MGDEDPEFDVLEYKCQACDVFGPVDDLCLCETCSGKLERDMIRQRAWDYSASAFGVRPEDRETLRKEVIAKHGEALELIAPDDRSQASRGQRRRRRTQ